VKRQAQAEVCREAGAEFIGRLALGARYTPPANMLSSPPRKPSTSAREIAMAKGQMRSNKEKKKPKADKNIKKGGATPSPFSSGKTPAGQAPNSKK
jgi:hypothetical protein